MSLFYSNFLKLLYLIHLSSETWGSFLMCLVSTFVFMFLFTGTTDNASPAQSRSSSKKSNASNGTPSSHSTTHAIQAQADSPNKETTVSNNRKKKGRLFHSFMSFFLANTNTYGSGSNFTKRAKFDRNCKSIVVAL